MLSVRFLLLFLFAIYFCLPQTLFSAGKDAFAFLLVGPGARPSGMGESYVAVAEGAETLNWNPAGIAFERQRQWFFGHLFFVEGSLIDSLAMVLPFRHGAWGIQMGTTGVGGLTRTVVDSTVPDGFREVGDFSTYGLDFSLSFAEKVTDTFSLGATVRGIRQSLSDETANACSVDAGFLYRDDENPLQIGCAVQHLGSNVQFRNETFNLPRLARMGFALRQLKDSKLKGIPPGSLASLEVSRLWDESDNSIGGGVEVPLLNQTLFLRSGYHTILNDQNLGTQISLPNGFDFGIGFLSNGYRLDYALGSMGELGLIHRLSISIKFES